MVVDREDLESSSLKLSGDGIDFRAEEHEVTHGDHVLPGPCLLEGRPAAERESGLDGNAREADVQVRPGPAVPAYFAGLVLARTTEHFIHGLPAAGRGLGDDGRRDAPQSQEQTKRSCLHSETSLVKSEVFLRND